MILLFGGTTEGRKAVEVLEASGSTYYYATKTGEQEVALHHGIRADGAMDAAQMRVFCTTHGIRLLCDAAHPFAANLHRNVAETAEALQLPAIRYERIFPPRDETITWIDDYSEMPRDIHRLLATTGVQSIARLKSLEKEGMSICYRILRRESSVALALQQGARQEQLCYYDHPADIPVAADALLLKESGLSGGFLEKVAAAKARGMRIIALKRPETLPQFTTVNGPYGLRREVERLLPDFFALKSGLTTGTCATAAAIAATRRLRYGETPEEVDVRLPNGETITVSVGYGADYAYCIKQAGDDPDVTDGIEVRAKVTPAPQFAIYGGEGVGRFTLPGFDYPPGEPAINRSPRQMLRDNIRDSVAITIYVPQGEEIAKKTFNPRLGIEGGISIIGVSGIVMPFSEEAFLDSIRKCMVVAKASGSPRVVCNSGAKSERYVRACYPELPQQAFVEYGNYIGETLQMAAAVGFREVTLGVMMGKAVKLAEGQLDTHSRRSTMNKDFIQQMLDEAGISRSAFNVQRDAFTLARELWERIPEQQTEAFCQVVLRHCRQHCLPLVPQTALTLLLIGDDGTIHSLSPGPPPAP